MQKQNGANNHLGTFWPVIIIFVLAAFVGGIVVVLAFNNSLQEQIDSLMPAIHKPAKPAAEKKPAASKSAATKK